MASRRYENTGPGDRLGVTLWATAESVRGDRPTHCACRNPGSDPSQENDEHPTRDKVGAPAATSRSSGPGSAAADNAHIPRREGIRPGAFSRGRCPQPAPEPGDAGQRGLGDVRPRAITCPDPGSLEAGCDCRCVAHRVRSWRRRSHRAEPAAARAQMSGATDRKRTKCRCRPICPLARRDTTHLNSAGRTRRVQWFLRGAGRPTTPRHCRPTTCKRRAASSTLRGDRLPWAGATLGFRGRRPNRDRESAADHALSVYLPPVAQNSPPKMGRHETRLSQASSVGREMPTWFAKLDLLQDWVESSDLHTAPNWTIRCC